MAAPKPAPGSLDSLLLQARRLRFTDPELERRFREERQAAGRLRSQVTAAVALLFVAGVGWRQALREAAAHPEFIAWSLHYRFLVVAPFWVLLLVSSILPGHLRRAEWVYGMATVGALWGLAVMSAGLRDGGLATASFLTVDYGLVLLTSVIVLPLRFRALLATVLAGGLGGLALVRYLLPTESVAYLLAQSNFSMISLVAIALGWGLERNNRMLFAQREHARALNAELERTNAELARLNAEKNEFMAVAAHDLRAPLGVVRGLLELAGDGKLGSEARRGEALRQALGETERMHTLVENYLGAHAAESGRVPVRLARLDLGAAARGLAARHATTAAAKRQTLATDAPEGRVWVQADEALLAQVGDNFVSNALKFSPEGAAVRLELLAAPGNGVARLAVTDEGPGIPTEEQGRLFQKFTRGTARPTAGESSAGLGLAVAKRLAEAMGGRVGCDSPVNGSGSGASFWVELPEAR